jgi:hypothetical protein
MPVTPPGQTTYVRLPERWRLRREDEWRVEECERERPRDWGAENCETEWVEIEGERTSGSVYCGW